MALAILCTNNPSYRVFFARESDGDGNYLAIVAIKAQSTSAPTRQTKEVNENILKQFSLSVFQNEKIIWDTNLCIVVIVRNYGFYPDGVLTRRLFLKYTVKLTM